MNNCFLFQLPGQRGMRVRDLIAALITEKKVRSSPRIKLAIHRIPINEDADAYMLHNQTIILENREPGFVEGKILAFLDEFYYIP